MNRRVALVTGATGEMGHELIPELSRRGFRVAALDLVAPPEETARHCVETVAASVLDTDRMRRLFELHRPTHVFHLAAVLSSKAESNPDLAHRVNVEGTYGLFRICEEQRSNGSAPVVFFFPSSIAVYGLPDPTTKRLAGAVKESEWTVPAGMYGCNKLYCELIGSYLSDTDMERHGLDFRSIRFPGLISADTLPTGGTTDYAPEMIHAAAQNKPYACFVDAEARLPFMTMPDAIEAIVRLSETAASRLSTRIYNIRGFSASAAEIHDATLAQFPGARVAFEPIDEKQAIVDTWPADVDDSHARTDWGLEPRHGLAEALGDYLVPALRRRYGVGVER